MRLHSLKNTPGAVHRRKRVGCGEGGGHGKTSGKGGTHTKTVAVLMQKKPQMAQAEQARLDRRERQLLWLNVACAVLIFDEAH